MRLMECGQLGGSVRETLKHVHVALELRHPWLRTFPDRPSQSAIPDFLQSAPIPWEERSGRAESIRP